MPLGYLNPASHTLGSAFPFFLFQKLVLPRMHRSIFTVEPLHHHSICLDYWLSFVLSAPFCLSLKIFSTLWRMGLFPPSSLCSFDICVGIADRAKEGHLKDLLHSLFLKELNKLS